jgi:hypothetical protein
MNAPELLKHMKTPGDDGLVLRLKTLTPLYTGGIGQEGDQIHPSNLLGGVRHFSCLVARALGDAAFEGTVWGNAGQGGVKAEAKQVALHWDLSGLKSFRLPGEIRIPKNGGDQSKWWFNTGYEGALDLTLTRRGISDANWQMLQLALAIQVRHATFGAKDQFGLGVLGWQGAPFKPVALDVSHPWPKAEGFSFMRYAFARVELTPRPGEKPRLQTSSSLVVALGLRSSLRNALRAKENDPPAEQERLKALRHLMLGKLNIAGSAVNVSAAYPTPQAEDAVEARIAVALKPDTPEARKEVMTRFRSAVNDASDSISASGYKVGDVTWQFGGAHTNDKAAWLNQLAGA